MMRTTWKCCTWPVTGSHTAASRRLDNRVPQGAFERLEPDEVKASRPVLRGGGGGNTASLPGVILDIYSRYVVGWLLAERESATLAEALIAETCAKQGIERDQLTIHADRGSSMCSKTVALLLADLGVTKTHSRPYTSTDNPYSEAQFRTLKYRPNYPDRFGSLQDARSWARAFFHWYNHQHHHSGLGLLTPATVHYGQTEAVRAKRQQVLLAAYAAHPERFVRGVPTPPELPKEVWINKPKSEVEPESLVIAAPESILQTQPMLPKFQTELSKNA